MDTYQATVIKTGNSLALRIPKHYATDAKLEIGQKVELLLPAKKHKKQDLEKIKNIITALQALSPYKEIDDPVAWQRAIRQDRPLDR